MYKILRVNIKRFRSILDLKLNLNSDINYISLCGENNSGKTNTLRALNIFFNPESYVPKYDAPYHKFEGTRGSAVYPEIIVDFLSSDGKVTRISRKFGKDKIDASKGTSNVNKNKSERTELNSKQVNEFLNKFAFFFIESINISTPKAISSVIEGVYDLEYENAQFRGAKKELKESFDKYVSGLERILSQLGEDINPKFKEYKKNWGVAFDIPKDIKKFRDFITDDINFYINDSSNKRVEGKGAGLQRLSHILLHFRIVEKIKNKQVILLIDEPDIYLHERLQRKLLEDLKSLNSNIQIFVTTHSPVFIDTVHLRNVFLLEQDISKQYFKRRKKEFSILETKLVNFSDDNGSKKIKEYLGVETEEYEVLERYNIIVEGDTDKKYLETLIEYFKLECPNLIPAHGVDKIAGYLEFYDSYYKNITQTEQIKPKILVLLDNDVAGREVSKKINDRLARNKYKSIEVNCKFIPTYNGEILKATDNPDIQIEDFLYPKLIVYLVNELLKKRQLNLISAKNVAEKIAKPAFKSKGILYVIENEKNENNPENGQIMNFTGSSDQIKSGIAGSFKIEANPTISSIIETESLQFPEVENFLREIVNSSD